METKKEVSQEADRLLESLGGRSEIVNHKVLNDILKNIEKHLKDQDRWRQE